MAYNPYGGYPPPGYNGYGAPGGPPGRMNGGMPMNGPPMNGPPVMGGPGMGPPPGMAPSMHNPVGSPMSRNPNLPMGFTPPPNINFNARVIRLGTTNKAGNGAHKDGLDSPATPLTPLGPAHGRHGAGGAPPASGVLEQSRANAREAQQALIPPTADEKLRTVFVGNIPMAVGQGIEKVLATAGKLKRFDSAAGLFADKDKPDVFFGFATYEEVESVAVALELLRGVKLPTKKQEPVDKSEHKKGDDKDNAFPDIEKTEIILAIDEQTTKHLDSKITEPATISSKVEKARSQLTRAVRDLFRPPPPSASTLAGSLSADAIQVVNINVAGDDELSDIPPEMREMVAGEIAAFRERSTQRDLERMRREEELEERERLRNNAGSGRTRSPPRGVPTGPRAATGGNSGGGNGMQILASSGLSHADLALYKEHEDTDASDEELDMRERDKKKKEQDSLYADAERKWSSRERSRTAALEREREREEQERSLQEKVREETLKEQKEWDDVKMKEDKGHLYYRDHAAWARKRAVEREDEAARDAEDRLAEEEELRRAKREQEKQKSGESTTPQTKEKEKEAAPQPFKLSLGAAAQKAQAKSRTRTRRTVAEVETLLDADADAPQAKRQLIPITHEPASSLSDAEITAAVKGVAAEIPADQDGLWKWPVAWEFLDDEIIRGKVRPFVEKKVVEYLGVQEEVIVEVIEECLRSRRGAEEVVEELTGALEEVEELVRRVWRMVVFYSECEKRGLPA